MLCTGSGLCVPFQIGNIRLKNMTRSVSNDLFKPVLCETHIARSTSTGPTEGYPTKPIHENTEKVTLFGPTAKPIEACLYSYAKEYIDECSRRDIVIDAVNCAHFAAGLLVYVRRRFYSEIKGDDGRKEGVGNNNMKTYGKHQQTTLLTLENMRWIYDNIIRPVTDQFRPGLFLCNGCDTSKLYPLPAVLNHYAAKHTNSFRKDDAVLSWEVEWPSKAPFNPDNNKIEQAMRALPGMTEKDRGHRPSSWPFDFTGPSLSLLLHSGPRSPELEGSKTSLQTSHEPNDRPGSQLNSYSGGATSKSTLSARQEYRSQELTSPGSPIKSSESILASHEGLNIIDDTRRISTPPEYQHRRRFSMDTSNPPGNYSNPEMTTDQPILDDRPLTPRVIEAFPAKFIENLVVEMNGTWSILRSIDYLPNDVKLHITICQAAKNFFFKFHEIPILEMFIAALMDDRAIKAIRFAPGVSCQICTDEMLSKSIYPNQIITGFVKVLTLVEHFYYLHERRPNPLRPGAFFDWKTDMVSLPPRQTIQEVARMERNDSKLKLISEVFPDLSFSSRHDPSWSSADHVQLSTAPSYPKNNLQPYSAYASYASPLPHESYRLEEPDPRHHSNPQQRSMDLRMTNNGHRQNPYPPRGESGAALQAPRQTQERYSGEESIVAGSEMPSMRPKAKLAYHRPTPTDSRYSHNPRKRYSVELGPPYNHPLENSRMYDNQHNADPRNGHHRDTYHESNQYSQPLKTSRSFSEKASLRHSHSRSRSPRPDRRHSSHSRDERGRAYGARSINNRSPDRRYQSYRPPSRTTGPGQYDGTSDEILPLSQPLASVHSPSSVSVSSVVYSHAGSENQFDLFQKATPLKNKNFC
jgi:hypothetical protein